MDARRTTLVLFLHLQSTEDCVATVAETLRQARVDVRSAAVSLAADAHAEAQRVTTLVDTHRPALVLLLLDSDASADRRPLAGLLRLLSIDVPLVVLAGDFDASTITAMLDPAATNVTPPRASAPVSIVLPQRSAVLARHVPHRGEASDVRGQLVARHLALIGESPAFTAEIKKLPSLSNCDVAILISGETGTGKELIARAIHYLSPRCDEPFVPVDCGAIPPELAESELFGHERGAFTSAVTKSDGLIASTRQGTLFLDEVDALPLSVQVKLLRFLQQREYRPLGSHQIRKADVRVIAATNSDLRDRMRRGEFREDLYYRLNVVELCVPPLRSRSDDIIVLSRHFIAKWAARFNRPVPALTAGALQRLIDYEWPGNVRELENVLEAAVALASGAVIDADELPLITQPARGTRSFREAKARAVEEFERGYICRLLEAHGGNITAAARAAKKNRRAFWELVRKHRIDVRKTATAARGLPAQKVSTAPGD